MSSMAEITNNLEGLAEWHIFYNPASQEFNEKMFPILHGNIEGEKIYRHKLISKKRKLDQEEITNSYKRDGGSNLVLSKTEYTAPKLFYSELSTVVKELGSDQCGDVLNEEFFDHSKIFASINIVIVRIRPSTQQEEERTIEEEKDQRFKGKIIDTVCTIRALNEYENMYKFWETDKNSSQPDFYYWNEEMKNLPAEHEKRKHLYIDGICSSSGKAKPLLKFLEGKLPDIRKNSAYNAISLSAINYVILYYYKLGYRSGIEIEDKLMKDMACDENFMSPADEKLFVDGQWTKLIVGWAKTKLKDDDDKDTFRKVVERAKRVKFTDNYKKRMTAIFENLKEKFGGTNLLENGWYMYNDGSLLKTPKERLCVMQGGGKNSKKRTKKKAPRRRRKRRRRRTKKRSCKKRMTKKTICLKGINKKAMRKLVKVTKKLGKMKGIKMTRCSKRRIKKWTKKKRRR
jgi:hypothetical protein